MNHCTGRYALTFAIASTLALNAFVPVVGQQPAKPPAAPAAPGAPRETEQEVIRVESSEVLLDMVVRDRRGKPVRDLRADEIEVFEDGVKQKVNAFRLVEGDAPGSAAPSAGAAATANVPAKLNPLRHINLVTLVFDNLNIEARQLAGQAARSFLDSELRSNDMVAVFTVGNRLHVVQQFTTDRKLLREAVERATTGGNTQFQSKSDEIRQQLDTFQKQSELAETLGTAAGNSRGAGAEAIGAANVEAKTAEITLNALQFAETLQREQQGRSSLYALLALVKDQGKLQGRKTLIYFSEGLQVPANLVELKRATVSAANRANVSIYAVDARGLQTTNVNAAAGEMLAQSARASRSQILARPGSAVTREQALATDRAEDSLRGNVQGALDDLATSTGGFLIANSNNLRTGMQHVVGDIGSYYELAYTPPSRKYDGKFHTITIKASRPSVKLQTREGYFDLPPVGGGGALILPYEMPLVATLNAERLPRSFEYRAVALRFGENQEGVQYNLLMEVPLANFTFTTDAEKKVYRAQFSMMALIRDAGGRVVQKLSRDFPLEGGLDRLAAVKNGFVTLTKTYRLTPGRYTLETVALDRETNRTSARRSVFVVTPPKPGVRMSSLAVIKRVESLSLDSQDAEDPFRKDGSKIVPFVGEPALLAGKGGLPLYMIIYPAAGVAEQPQLALEFLLDGQAVSQAAPELPAPDGQGRIQYVMTAPLENFKPGRYEVRAVVRQGATAAEEHTFFTINP
ncbi:MAG: VWA domain-containing protein [Acidobacteriota bacterium]|nr:VWA domain-containing protein [Acidobacteriota bacterium]